MVFSVCLSVCLSVRLSVTPFWLCSHHRIIMKFSGVITTDQGNVHAKGQGQRSKVKVTEVTTQLYRFRTVTPVWIHICRWNDAYSLMLLRRGALLFLAATKQLYEWFSPSVRLSVRLSVCLSVRPSVCHTFLTMFPSSYHHEIFRSYYQWQKWRPCKRSRSEVKGQGHRGHDPNFRFRTVTPVWIHIWWWNDTYSLMLLRRGALLFFKVIRQISRSHGAKIAEFDPDWAFPDCNSSLNSPMAKAAQSGGLGGLVRRRPILTGRKNGFKIRPNRLSSQQGWWTGQTTHI